MVNSTTRDCVFSFRQWAMGHADKAIPLLRAAYSFDRSRDDWMQELCTRAAPLLDLGQGVALAAFRVDAAMRPNVDAFFQHGTSVDYTATAMRLQHVAPYELVERSYLRPGFVDPLISGRDDVTAEKLAATIEVLAAAGLAEILGVGASATPRYGIVLNAPMVLGQTIDPKLVALWRHLLAHIRCALRLFERYEEASEEAVLEPGTGKVLHAEEAAQGTGVQQRLRAHARAIDRASSRAGRADPENALLIWRGLVDGTWSLIDRFDTDGRHFVVARRNEPQSLDPRRLAKREWQVSILCATGASNKHIAYELGISLSTVGTHLSRAMHKLGCRNRVELAELTRRAWLNRIAERT